MNYSYQIAKINILRVNITQSPLKYDLKQIFLTQK